MNRQGKVWGSTKCLYDANNVEIHEVFIQKDGYCSRHSHTHKANQFYVMSGKLKVIIWKDYGNGNQLEDVTVMGPGELCIVPPGDDHRFIALEDTHALEIYDVRLDRADIKRVDHGGMLHYAEKTDSATADRRAGKPNYSGWTGTDDCFHIGRDYSNGAQKVRHSEK